MDNPAKRGRADRSRVALSQSHERRYLTQQIDQAGKLVGSLAMTLLRVHERLLAGTPRPARTRKARK